MANCSHSMSALSVRGNLGMTRIAAGGPGALLSIFCIYFDGHIEHLKATSSIAFKLLR